MGICQVPQLITHVLLKSITHPHKLAILVAIASFQGQGPNSGCTANSPFLDLHLNQEIPLAPLQTHFQRLPSPHQLLPATLPQRQSLPGAPPCPRTLSITGEEWLVLEGHPSRLRARRDANRQLFLFRQIFIPPAIYHPLTGHCRALLCPAGSWELGCGMN